MSENVRPEMVLFDFGNVIARFDNRWFISRLLHGIPHDPEELVRRIFSESSLSRDFESGRSDLVTFQSGIEKIIGRHFSPAAFEAAYCDIFQLIPETVELIRELKGKTRIGMLSNTNPLHYERVISRIPNFQDFDQVTVSFEVNAMKPAPEIYLDALKKFGKPAGDILYLDDVPGFVEGAKAQGLRAWVYDDPPVLLEKVRGLFASA